MASIRYDSQVAVITGAGNGLGKQYALFFASRGAKIVVKDMGGDIHGRQSRRTNDKQQLRVADAVVQEIRDAGGIAVANYDTVLDGAKIIQTAIDAFGRIDILVNNAGILRDVTLRNMSDKDWDTIMAVHLNGAMLTTRAAWPHFKRQKYGRVVNTTSTIGLLGNFGQPPRSCGRETAHANRAAARCSASAGSEVRGAVGRRALPPKLPRDGDPSSRPARGSSRSSGGRGRKASLRGRRLRRRALC